MAALSKLVDVPFSTILGLARNHLDMDVAIVVACGADQAVCSSVQGDADSFGISADAASEVASTICMRMLNAEIPFAVPDTSVDVRARELGINSAAGIGAYIGVPITFPDGSSYGTFCCLSHHPVPFRDGDVGFMQLLSDLLMTQLDSEREHDLERARMARLLDGAQLQVALQPIFDLQDGRCVGVEALARFPAPFGSPETVFERAHAVGLGLPLERLALRAAMPLIPALDPAQFLAVNLTPQVATQLAEAGAAHPELLDRLVLEITEHDAIRSYAQLRQALEPSRSQGLRLAIDDAGAGYACLKHVVELAPDIIKIDRSLVDGAATDRARRSAISAFVLLALDTGAYVVAEGVEAPADLDALQDLGVDAVQGYLLARPTTDRHAIDGWKGPSRLLGRSPPTVPFIARPRAPSQSRP